MIKDIRKTLRFSQKEYLKISEELQNANVTFSDFARSAILKKKLYFQKMRHFHHH